MQKIVILLRRKFEVEASVLLHGKLQRVKLTSNPIFTSHRRYRIELFHLRKQREKTSGSSKQMTLLYPVTVLPSVIRRARFHPLGLCHPFSSLHYFFSPRLVKIFNILSSPGVFVSSFLPRHVLASIMRFALGTSRQILFNSEVRNRFNFSLGKKRFREKKKKNVITAGVANSLPLNSNFSKR